MKFREWMQYNKSMNKKVAIVLNGIRHEYPSFKDIPIKITMCSDILVVKEYKTIIVFKCK